MELLQLLRQELKEWPEGIREATQDRNGDVSLWEGGTVVERPNNAGCCYVGLLFKVECFYEQGAVLLADEYGTAIVTKDQYEGTGKDEL